jgi:hypothetical protein
MSATMPCPAGIDGNPLAVIARQMGVPMHEIRNRCPLYLEDGTEAPADLDAQVMAGGLLELRLRVLWLH